LTAKKIGFESINYMDEPLTADELSRLLDAAGLKPQEAIRANEAAYRQHVMGKNLSDEQLVRVMAKYSELIQRPIVVRGNKAVLARPVEKLADLGIK
jgi:arsenate reductase